jgi:hypothetical protein
VPFLSSIDTVSLFSFIKNLFILKIRFVHIRTKKKKPPIKFERERQRERERDLTSFIVGKEEEGWG